MPLLDAFALANQEAGNALGIYLYVKGSGSAQTTQAITDLAFALPKIPLGQLDSGKLGGLTAELESALASVKSDNAAGAAIPAQGGGNLNLSQLTDQLGSLLGMVTQDFPSASGGLVSVDQAVVSTQLGQWSSGLTNALAFEKGKAAGSLAAAT